jgi:AbrB family looped-hinge helix DNA binding protein
MIEIVKVSSRGQFVIPEIIRNQFGIEEGTKLVLIEKDKQIILEKEIDFLKKIDHQTLQKDKKSWLYLTEKSLAKEWLCKEEDETWKNL